MNKIYSEFKRLFSVSMYKNLRIKLGEMSFTKDFINDKRGDLYPVTSKSEECVEVLEDNLYALKKGTVKRLFCRFFPYASYEISAKCHDGQAGFCFNLQSVEAKLVMGGGKLIYTCEDVVEERILPESLSGDASMAVGCRPGAFDIYFKVNGKAKYFCTFNDEHFANSNNYSAFSNGYVHMTATGTVVINEVLSYVDNGISVADIRPIRYENGEVMLDGGKIYLTASVRMEEEMFQGVYSWIPGTAEFELTGAVFYDSGDNRWCGDVAASVLYHREKKQWYLWVCSFSHGHILGSSVFEGDIRFGVNVVDIKLMEKAEQGTPISEFKGFTNDEDPDFFYDEGNGRWLMSICRINPETSAYSYVFFESENPFDGYEYVGKGPDGCETGGSFVKVDGELFFVCGNDFNKTSDYRIYSKNGMQNVKFNYPDGGFRGWGTVIPVKQGSRTRYYFLTFDRHNGSGYNWSYGNLYCYEL